MLTIDLVLKLTESKSGGLNARGIQGDIEMVGPPHIAFGTDGALVVLLVG